jgi:hypothetical protein
VFEGRNSSGQLVASEHMFIEQSFDNVCFDPGAQAVLTGLSVPTGY